MHKFVDEFSQLSSPSDQDQYLSELLSFAADIIATRNVRCSSTEELQEELQETKAALQSANARIESAKEYVRDLKADAENASKRARKETYRNLQIVRDRVYAIIETAVVAGERIETNSRSKVSLTELNNIIAAANTIIQEMKKQDLWTDLDATPEVKVFAEKPSAKKKRSSATSSGSENSQTASEDQIALTME